MTMKTTRKRTTGCACPRGIGRNLLIMLLAGLFPVFSIISPCEAQSAPETGYELHSFSRLIAFDEHPTTLDPLGTTALNFSGEQFTYTIELQEAWLSRKNTPTIQGIGYKLHVLKPGEEKQTLIIPQVDLITRELTKGSIIASGRTGKYGLEVVLDSWKGSGKHPIAVELSFKLKGFGETPSSPSQETTVAPPPPTEPSPTASASATIPAPNVIPPALTVTPLPTGQAPGLTKSASALSMARFFLERAIQMDNAQAAGKKSMLKKAWITLPTDDTSPEGETLRAAIKEEEAKLAAMSSASSGSDAKSGGTGSSSPAEPLYQEARKLLAQQDEVKARELLRQATEKDPAFFPAWSLLAENALKNSKYARAREFAQAALGLRPDDLTNSVAFFKACFYLGEPEIGTEKLSALVNRLPESLPPRIALAEAHMQTGNLPACEAECLIILEKHSGNYQAKALLEKARARMK